MTNAKGNVLVEDFIAKFEEELPLTWQNEAKLEVIQVWTSMAGEGTVTDNCD